MERKSGRKLRGRPLQEQRTALAIWINRRGISVTDFAARLAETATRLAATRPELGIRPEDAPRPKTLLDAVNARHWPHAILILLTRLATNGQVRDEHWVQDLRRRGTR